MQFLTKRPIQRPGPRCPVMDGMACQGAACPKRCGYPADNPTRISPGDVEQRASKTE